MGVVGIGARQPASIQGVWQIVEVRVGPGGQTVHQPQTGVLIVTPKYYSRTEQHTDSPRPTLANNTTASAEELRATWGPFQGEAGRYEIAGNRITLRPMVAKNPAAMTSGAYTTSSFQLEGNSLIVTLLSNERGPVATPATIKMTRLE
jgi:hypothetical protein